MKGLYERLRLAQHLAECLQSIEDHDVTSLHVGPTFIGIESDSETHHYVWRLLNSSGGVEYTLFAHRYEIPVFSIAAEHLTPIACSEQELVIKMSQFARQPGKESLSHATQTRS